MPWLKDTVVAYINCDVAASGPVLMAAASPLLNQAVYKIAELVQSPNQTKDGQTVGDVWDGKIDPLGSGSDFTAFLDHAGIASVDLGFGRATSVYHYHSNYDSFHWMSQYGDVGFKYHVTIAKLLSLLTAQLSESPILSLNTTDYATALSSYLSAAKNHSAISISTSTSTSTLHSLFSLSDNVFLPIESSISTLLSATVTFEQQSTRIADSIKNLNHKPRWNPLHKSHHHHHHHHHHYLYHQARAINRKYRLFEQQFLYAKGLDGRSWFKHTVFAPGKWTGYSGATFPGLIEALDEGDEEALGRWAGIVRERIDAATELLLST